MSTSNKSRVEALDEFLLDYLPHGTDQGDHDLVVVMLEAVRRHIARRLALEGSPCEDDEEDRPMRDEAALRAREYAAGRGEDQSDETSRGPDRGIC